MILHVTDPDDPRLDDFRDLQDADVRPDKRGVVIAEGVNVVERMLRSVYRVRAVMGVAARLEALADALPADVPAYQADKVLLSQVAGFRVTRGVLAAADRRPEPDPATLLRSARRIAVLESLNDFEISARCSATPPRSAWTPSCSTRRPPTRSTAAASGSRWATCSASRSRACTAPGPSRCS